MEWNPRRRPPVHAHIVHPSPVRAHSYPFASLYDELSLEDEFDLKLKHSEHEHLEFLAISQVYPDEETLERTPSRPPQPVHNWSYSTSSSHGPDSPASIVHDLPSPPLSSNMPDPWSADRDESMETDEHERELGSWGGRHVLPPPDITLPAKRPPLDTKRSMSPMSKSLLAPLTLEVWSSLMDRSKGRDKVLKVVQYSLRTYLYLLGVIAGVRPLSRWFLANRIRSKQAVAGLSLTRKCLLLLNPLRPAGALLSPEPTSARAFLGHLVDLCSAVADDIFCLSKLGLVAKSKGVKADTWANRIWFVSTLVGLWTLHVKSYTTRKDDEKRADEWQLRKYLCDLVFVSYDIFHLQRAKEPVQCIAGLGAALIATGTLYRKEYDLLARRA